MNRSALRHQIELLKGMGANAIRTSHNMPAPELVELCDEMGMMLMVEPLMTGDSVRSLQMDMVRCSMIGLHGI